MDIEQRIWEHNDWKIYRPSDISQAAQIVFLFGNRELLKNKKHVAQIKDFYPNADIVGCSTSGEIFGEQVSVDSMVATAVHFEKTEIKITNVNINELENSYQAGERLASDLPQEDLLHVFILSEGLGVNGSELIKGLTSSLPQGVIVTGGLAGDQARFKETVTVYNEKIDTGMIVAVGFYGKKIKTGYGSMGGWDSFGIDRVVTKSEGNVVYELDGKPALDLYKTYLGEQAKELPASGLLFPLSLRLKDSDATLVRTILAVDEEKKSMTFAGDVPQGHIVRLMKANSERLVDGASGAAQMAKKKIGSSKKTCLALLVSCVGRKLVLKQRVEEEIEIVKQVLPDDSVLTGFYSYGELCPTDPDETRCELHNQTMTITLFCED